MKASVQAFANVDILISNTGIQIVHPIRDIGFYVAEREGFEPPVPQAVQQISSLPQSTTLPPLRGRRILSGGRDLLGAAHVISQRRGHRDRAVRVLVVLEDRDQGAADREA